MGINEETSVGKSCQSMETKGICILLTNEDITCYNIVAEMLQHCSYEVLHVGVAVDVLNAIWEKKDLLELVLTNAHKFLQNGIEIIQHIQQKINLPIVLMSPDTTKIMSQGRSHSFTAYVLNGLSRNAVNNLWQFALEKEKAKMVAANQEVNAQRASTADNSDDTKKSSDQNSKRKRSMEKNEGSLEETSMEKKPRVMWTPEMHQKFLEAIKIIGYDKAVPKKIVEVMSIPGLTRENVASHLQKFRGGLKRAQELALTSLSGCSTTNEFKAPFVVRPHSTPIQDSLERNPYSLSESSRTKSLQQNHLNTQNKFSLSRNNYTNLGNLQFGDQREVDNFQQKYVPRFQLNRNFRIYGDQTKNMLLSISEGGPSSHSNQNNSGIFVGYRLTNDGNSIEFGNKEASVKDIMNSETQFSAPGNAENQFNSYVHQNSISQAPFLMGIPPGETSFQCASVSEIPGNESSVECVTIPVENLPEELLSLLSSLETENQVQITSTPLNSVSQQHLPVQSLETLRNEYTDTLTGQELSPVSTDIHLINDILFHKLPENEVHVQDSSKHCQRSLEQPLKTYEVENVEKTESEFVLDQDFSLLQLDTYGTDAPTFFEGIQQQHSSPSLVPQMQQELNIFLDQEGIDDVLLDGTGSSCPQFDWDEFEDKIFNQDD